MLEAAVRRRYFAAAQSQPFPQMHPPLQAQALPQVQRAGLAAQPQLVV